MSSLKDLPHATLQFYATAPYACSYLPDRAARSQVATPSHLIDTAVYNDLLRNGFRRSGLFTYRPYCDACRACVPVRLPAALFRPNRAQKRSWRKHAQLVPRELDLGFNEEHFQLYQRYQSSRHSGGGMDQDSREQYDQFLLQSHIDTRLIEFREDGQLRLVCIIDVLSDGLSSVYTFFDPDVAGASYGSFAIQWQVAACQQMGRDYVYLGYYIRDCAKMNYKRQYLPIEGRVLAQWRILGPEDFAAPT